MKLLLVLILLFFRILGVSQIDTLADYLVTIRNDTIYGIIGCTNGNLWSKPEALISTDNNVWTDKKIPISEVKYLYSRGERYEPHPEMLAKRKPQLYFYGIIMQHDSCKIYECWKNSSFTFYFAVNDSFLTQVTFENYRNIFLEYFKQCETFIKEMDSKITGELLFELRMYKVAEFYRKNCN